MTIRISMESQVEQVDEGVPKKRRRLRRNVVLFFILSLPTQTSPPAILGGSARGDSGRVDQWRVW